MAQGHGIPQDHARAPDGGGFDADRHQVRIAGRAALLVL
jgi:hypothetical protein